MLRFNLLFVIDIFIGELFIHEHSSWWARNTCFGEEILDLERHKASVPIRKDGF